MSQADNKFWPWLRSGLRRLSQRYPPLYAVLAKAKRSYDGPNKRQKVCYECAECHGLFPGKEVAVDHIEACGSLTCKEDVADFIDKLFCEESKLQVLCKNCHDFKTLMDKYGYTKEEAIIEKQVIAFRKLSATEQTKLLQESIKCDTMPTNSKQRADAYREHLKGE